jgi:hypothetical protein
MELGNKLTDLDHQIERLVQLAAEGIDNTTVGSKIRALEATQKEMLASLSELEEKALVASPVAQRRRRDELLNSLRDIPFHSGASPLWDGVMMRNDLSAVNASELNVKMRMVFKGIVLDKSGGIQEWIFN